TNLGEDAAVHELAKRVHHGLRVDHDLHLVDLHTEEEVRLDYFQRLVDEGRRVHGDLAPHLPGRVLEGFGHARLAGALRAPGAERATRRREDETRQLRRAPARETLEHGAVLGVDRNDLAPAFPRR